MYRKVNFVFIVSIVALIGQVYLLGWNKTNCSAYNNKLLSILNILCNNTQVLSIQSRDACYGCFFRAGNLPAGQTQLITLSQCASIYLNSTAYALCAIQLQNVVNGIRPAPTAVTTPCYSGYCEFVRCIRRINANSLIERCFLENLVNRDLSVQNDRKYFYTNTTSCILAKARCNLYNPITGELQRPQQILSSASGVSINPLYLPNALQITPSGDLRLISFPASVGVADLFCSSRGVLDQSSFGNAVC